MTKRVVIDKSALELKRGQKLCGAYTIEHLVTTKRYHGATGDIRRRINEHSNDLSRGIHGNPELQMLVSENPELKLTFYPADNLDQALTIEQRLINHEPTDKLLNRSLSNENMAKGLWANPAVKERLIAARKGNTNAAGHKHTKEWKDQQSQRLQGNQHLSGHRHTEETRQKMSLAATGRTQSAEAIAKSAVNRRKNQVMADDTLYPSVGDAAAANGITWDGVKKRCKNPNFPTWKLIPICKGGE